MGHGLKEHAEITESLHEITWQRRFQFKYRMQSMTPERDHGGNGIVAANNSPMFTSLVATSCSHANNS